jgi:hypothetical protein
VFNSRVLDYVTMLCAVEHVGQRFVAGAELRFSDSVPQRRPNLRASVGGQPRSAIAHVAPNPAQ